MNIGNIKSDGLNVVSRTRDRMLSLTLSLLPLCSGNIVLFFSREGAKAQSEVRYYNLFLNH